jgi:hypothetical protein
MLGWVVALAFVTASDGEAPQSRQAQQDALKPFAGLVGEWRGVGQPRRGATRDAWRESSEWSWSLTKDSAALVCAIEDGKHVRSLKIIPEAEGKFRAEATLADGSKLALSGKLNPKKVLILEADRPASLARLTLTPLHETRYLLLMEKAGADGRSRERIGEVGYTRQGVAFAAGESGPICVVTGGKGTIRVTHREKTYWVCCTGCKDLFESDPADVLAEAKAEGRLKSDP